MRRASSGRAAGGRPVETGDLAAWSRFWYQLGRRRRAWPGYRAGHGRRRVPAARRRGLERAARGPPHLEGGLRAALRARVAAGLGRASRSSASGSSSPLLLNAPGRDQRRAGRAGPSGGRRPDATPGCSVGGRSACMPGRHAREGHGCPRSGSSSSWAARQRRFPWPRSVRYRPPRPTRRARWSIVNGVPGRRVDVCVNGTEYQVRSCAMGRRSSATSSAPARRS